MIELTEESVKDFIKEGKVVIKAWGDGCGYCTEYAPIFDKYVAEYPNDAKYGSIKLDLKQPSAFKRAYMKNDKGGEKNTIPATFIFENGELKHTAWGRLFEPQLKAFIETGTVPPTEQDVKRRKLYELFAQKGELVHNLEILNTNLQRVNQEIVDIQKGK